MSSATVHYPTITTKTRGFRSRPAHSLAPSAQAHVVLQLAGRAPSPPMAARPRPPPRRRHHRHRDRPHHQVPHWHGNEHRPGAHDHRRHHQPGRRPRSSGRRRSPPSSPPPTPSPSTPVASSSSTPAPSRWARSRVRPLTLTWGSNLSSPASRATWSTDGRLISTPSHVAYASGTATAGGASTLTNGAKTWTTNQWTNYQVRITGGTGSGQIRTIASNTGTASPPRRHGRQRRTPPRHVRDRATTTFCT